MKVLAGSCIKHPSRWLYPSLVMLLLGLASMACVLSSPETLNDGRGTRDNPVPPRTYAHTLDYDIQALSVVWEQQDDSEAADSQEIPLRVQFQIHCNEPEDKVCRLEDVRDDIRLVDASGVLYEPVSLTDVESPLEGEILGKGEKAGWLAFRIPRGVEITVAVAEYRENQRVFFQLP